MPQVVDTPHGQLELPDEFSPEQVRQAVTKALPQMAAQGVKDNNYLQPGRENAQQMSALDFVSQPINELINGITGTHLGNPFSMAMRGLSLGQPIAGFSGGRIVNRTPQTSPLDEGIATGLNKMVGSPLGVGLVAGGGLLPGIVGRGLAAGFTGNAILNAPQQAQQLGTLSVTGTPEEKQKAAGEALVNILGVVAGSLGVAKGGGEPSLPRYTGPKSSIIDIDTSPGQGIKRFTYPSERPQTVKEPLVTQENNVAEQGKPEVRESIKGVPESPTGDLNDKIAPVKYIGTQEGFGNIPAQRLYNLTEDHPELGVKGSTISERSIQKKGYTVPEDLTPEEQNDAQAQLQQELEKPTSMPNLQGGIGKGIKRAIANPNKEQGPETGAINAGILKDLLVREDKDRLGYTLDTPLVLMDPKVGGFAPLAKVTQQQMEGRLQNLAQQGKIPPSELEVYKEQGLGDFLKTSPTVKETAQWMQDNGPKVEVRKFGEGNQTPEQKEFLSLQHKLETWGVNFTAIHPDYSILNEEQKAVLKRYEELEDQKYWDSNNQSHWSFISPKEVSNMPGYVEVAVTTPSKQRAKINELSNKAFDLTTEQGARDAMYRQRDIDALASQPGAQDKFPSSHKFPPNAVGFGRGYMETLPDGKKVFHVVEVQSDWAQKQRELAKAEPQEGFNFSSQGFKKKEAERLKDPLLPHHETLVLKALINHAREQGATHIALSDAETAMMTEGHDRQTREYQVDEGEPGSQVLKIPQEQGMRLHYDKTMPSILERLMGKKGERVEFGGHKMAFDEETSYNNPELELSEVRKKLRKDLIFRNSDNTPKTSISARLYPIPPKGEIPHSLFGKSLTPKVEVEKPSIGSGIQKSLGKKSEEGSIINPIGWTKDMAEKAKNYWMSKDIRGAMKYTKDAAQNLAGNFATRRMNIIRNEVKRAFGREAELGEQSLTFAVEADGSILKLQDFKKTILSSTKLTPKEKGSLIPILNFVDRNWVKFKLLVKLYNHETLEQVKRENASGYDTPVRRRYVFHKQDVDTTQGFFTGGGVGESTNFKKQRVYETYADSLANGVKAQSLNAVDLLHERLVRGMTMVNNKAWVDFHRGVIDPVNKVPIIQNTKWVTRPDGSQYMDVPYGYTPEYLGGETVAVHNGYNGLMSGMSNPSWWEESPIGQSLQKYNQNAKSVSLLFDSFHMIRVGFWQSMIKAAGLSTFEAPLPTSFWSKKYKTLLEYTEPEIQKMISNKEIPASWGKDITENQRIIHGLLNKGYNIGRVIDALYQDLIRSLPVIGTFNKYVFDQVQKSAMMQAGILEYKRYTKMYKGETDDQIFRRVALDLNKRFGTTGRQGWFPTQFSQGASRFLALAPQWNEGLIKSEVGAIAQAFETLHDATLGAKTGRRIVSGVLLRSVAGMVLTVFAMNQIINQITRKKFTWENPEEGIGAKLSAWIPVGEHGLFLHPMALGAEVSHSLMSLYEKKGNIADMAKDYLRSKGSQTSRVLWPLFTHEDVTGKKLQSDEVLPAMAKAVVPAPIPTKAVKALVTGKEEYPGQAGKQMLSSLGVKTDIVPSAGQQITRLAKKFNSTKGVSQNAEFYGGDYDKLVDSLRTDDEKTTKEELQKLIVQKGNKDVYQYFAHYENKEFTGSKKRETEFKETLTPNQLETYEKARDERVKIKEKYFALREKD